MRTAEHIKLSSLEATHWFYQGKRAIVRHWIERLHPLQQTHVLIDAGTGTGLFPEELQRHCHAIGLEASTNAIRLATSLDRTSPMIQGTVSALPFRAEVADIITALDILEHLDNDHQAMNELTRVLKKKGLLIIIVPAFRWAMSDWDRDLGHRRRYSLNDCLRLLAAQKSLELCELRYINNLLFLPILLYRKIRSRFFRTQPSRLEDQIPNRFLNQLLLRLFCAPAVSRRYKMPFGLSLLLIARKR